MQYLFSDEKTARNITKHHSKPAQAILDAIAWIRDKLGIQSQDAERAAELWNKAYNDSRVADGGAKGAASKSRYSATEKNSVVRFSTARISRLTESDVRSLLEKAQRGEFSNDTYIPLRINTPGVLIFEVSKYSKGETTIENLPIIMQVEKARQAMEESDGIYYENNRPHGLDVDAMISIIKGMDDPAYIVLQENGRYTEIVTYKDKGGKRAIAVLGFGDFKHAQYLNGYESGTYNILVTTYLPDSIESYLSNEENTIIYNKKDAPQSGSGSMLPSHLNGTPFFVDIVSQNSTGVKSVFGFVVDKKATGQDAGTSKSSKTPYKTDGTSIIPQRTEGVKEIFGFTVYEDAKVNEDLLEELSIHDQNAKVDRRGNVTVYHRTTAESAAEIRRTGIMRAKENALFLIKRQWICI